MTTLRELALLQLISGVCAADNGLGLTPVGACLRVACALPFCALHSGWFEPAGARLWPVGAASAPPPVTAGAAER